MIKGPLTLSDALFTPPSSPPMMDVASLRLSSIMDKASAWVWGQGGVGGQSQKGDKGIGSRHAWVYTCNKGCLICLSIPAQSII